MGKVELEISSEWMKKRGSVEEAACCELLEKIGCACGRLIHLFSKAERPVEDIWYNLKVAVAGDTYSGSGWTHYSIPAGQHYTGSRRYVFFVNDVDGGQSTSVYYKNVKLIEP